jgi:hypothetical protein
MDELDQRLKKLPRPEPLTSLGYRENNDIKSKRRRILGQILGQEYCSLYDATMNEMLYYLARYYMPFLLQQRYSRAAIINDIISMRSGEILTNRDKAL